MTTDATGNATVGQSAGTETPDQQAGASNTPQDNKTIKSDGASGATLNDAQPDIVKGTAYNVLHDYRSYNYIFTLAALEPASLADPNNYKNSSLKYVIVKSSGKGSATITNSLSATAVSNTAINKEQTVELINEFNKSSPGRFDFFIDNVEINSLMAFSESASTTLPTKIKFDLIEPYSMGGFLEALEVSSKAVGALTYSAATYVLKVEFIGYKATDNINEAPQVVDRSTRYFPMLINKVDIETTDRGTLYRVAATPVNEMGFGESNKIKADLKMTGDTVGAVIENMFANLNTAIRDEAKKAKGSDTVNYDTYEVFFAEAEKPGQQIVAKPGPTQSKEWKSAGSIWAATMNEELRGNPTYSFADPADAEKGQSGYKKNEDSKTNAPTIKYNPTQGAVHFAAGAEMHESIASVIRDSEYVKKIISQDIEKAKKGDGFVTYFIIRIETEYLEKNFDPQTLKRNQNYRYIIQPYKIHYTRLPGEQLGIADFKGAKNQIQRTYDYLYMGKNKDVINFQLKFNHLYFQAMPTGAGNKDSNDSTRGAGATNNPQVSLPKGDPNSMEDRKGTVAPIITSAGAASEQSPQGGSGQPKQATPYHQIALSMHKAILQSVDLAKATIEIFGDPYYIVTGGIGNQSHRIASPGITENGEASIYSTEPYININFRTPIDIGPDGIMQFNKDLLPFSGIYRVLSAASTFQGGVFKQKLTIIRMPGQLVEATKVAPSKGFVEKPKEGQQIVKDTVAPGVQTTGIKPNDFTLANLLNRGLPSAGLPGILSNFTNAGAGVVGAATGALTTVAGLGGAVQNIVGQVRTIAPQLGINVGSGLAGVNALASGIRLSASGVSNIVGGLSNAPAALVSGASGVVNSALSIPNAASSLASGVTSQVSALGGAVTGLGSSALATVSGLGSNASSLISGVGSKISALTNGVTNDPKALAAQVGIDPAQLSGLDPSLLSKVTEQLSSIAQKVPENVSITGAKAQGVIMSQLNGDTIANLPPIDTPALNNTRAIDVAGDSFEKIASASGSTSGLSGIPGITDTNLIKNTLGQAAGGLTAGLGPIGITALTDKLGTAQSSLNSIVSANAGALTSAQAGLGSVESNAANLAKQVQGAGSSAIANLSKSVTSQFGTQRVASPLDNLIASNNASTNNNNWGEG